MWGEGRMGGMRESARARRARAARRVKARMAEVQLRWGRERGSEACRREMMAVVLEEIEWEFGGRKVVGA